MMHERYQCNHLEYLDLTATTKSRPSRACLSGPVAESRPVRTDKATSVRLQASETSSQSELLYEAILPQRLHPRALHQQTSRDLSL
jgi:hypothetical protein